MENSNKKSGCCPTSCEHYIPRSLWTNPDGFAFLTLSLAQAVCQWRVVNRALREDKKKEIGTDARCLKG
ncbi:hypothetical protein H6F50_10215 [Coleofasciculus sp. FACHB-712]|uniref:hypothetical protein n=1 Tax=Cyanophyceae TaxID=3028117 RepID=UPI001686BAA9|nr:MULTISPECIES: hypothetical protein [unclassified Coleofasciculus]MBD1894337.1 hypothetical protein [Coleofasciculus sp. FACHB-129]MBD1942727.1 hypothetical protein [Coleofasciculus sp. FACHB-712]